MLQVDPKLVVISFSSHSFLKKRNWKKTKTKTKNPVFHNAQNGLRSKTEYPGIPMGMTIINEEHHFHVKKKEQGVK